jgi:hypothetical protein
LDEQLDGIPISQRRLGWEIAWKPVLTVADRTSAAGEYRRVEGTLACAPVYRAPRGTGCGGNNSAESQ